ncbi:MAG: Ppx/GppA family phosphatase [Sphingomonadales bacterium]|nr:MAG: Ppx/GppA family phosphatase [Sphingomonadales bacterium]
MRKRTAIIDIGSNSVRFVVYDGTARLPAILFNEKVMAGLGKSLSETGAIAADSLALARGALARFSRLAGEMRVHELRTVATAAVREASNGSELIHAAEALGLDVELLTGEQEAMAAGMGVLSAIPDADGIVGDLGGGSLELVRVVAGTVTDRISFPLGVLRIGAIRAKGEQALARTVAKLIGEAGWAGRGKDLPFYLVGGSWRSLARLDIHLSGFPLPIAHHYALPLTRITELGRRLATISKPELKAIPDLSSARLPTLYDATAVLIEVLAALGSSDAIVSAYGLREGLLFSRLAPEQRREDPLIAATREEGARLGRFAEHGDLLDAWIAPLFAEDSAEMARLRHAACLLADVGWHANPEFRAERGVEIALHGHWVGIDAAGRAIVAQALHTALGGAMAAPDPLGLLAGPEALHRARLWGLTIRLGQRLSGGVAGPIKRSRLARRGNALVLILKGHDGPLYSEAVEKRHKALANAMGLEVAVDR